MHEKKKCTDFCFKFSIIHEFCKLTEKGTFNILQFTYMCMMDILAETHDSFSDRPTCLSIHCHSLKYHTLLES